MRAGDLKRRVTFQARSSAQKDSVGQRLLNDWADVLANVPADIQSLTANEKLVANAMNSGLTHTIVVRYHPLLANSRAVAGMRAIYMPADGPMRIFELQGAENVDESNKTLNLSASEGMTNG